MADEEVKLVGEEMRAGADLADKWLTTAGADGAPLSICSLAAMVILAASVPAGRTATLFLEHPTDGPRLVRVTVDRKRPKNAKPRKGRN